MTLKNSATAVGVIVASLALGGGLVACSSDSGSSNSADGVSYITVNGSEPQNPLVPSNTNETGGGRIIDIINSGLVYYDADGNAHNELAESIETTDSQHYTITLKPDITFSDGSPITAHSFVDAWNWAVANSALGESFFASIKGYAEGTSSMSGLAIVDDSTFTVELSQPESDFPSQLGYSAFFPMPQQAFDDITAYGENPVSSGPYKLAEWNHNESATVVPNDQYQGDRKAQNDGIEFVFYSQLDAAYADLLAGNLDVLDTIPDSAFATYQSDLGDRAINQPAAIFQSFTIPNQMEHFTGEEGALRRQAISMAINREEITDSIFEGTRTPATDFTSPVIPGHSDSLAGADVLEFNPEKAKELWAQADAISPWSGSFQIAYNSDGGHQAWVDAVSNQIRNNLGIEASGAPYPDFKSLRDEITNRTIETAFRSGWQGDFPLLSNFLTPLYSTGASANDGDYSNPEVDSLLKEAAAAPNAEAAEEIYNQVQEILFKDLPAIPLWYANVVGGSDDTVSNVVFNWKSVPEYQEITKS